MARRPQILVIGHNDSGCGPEHERAAYEAGAEVARAGAVLVSGGMGGVMRASCRGAREAGGTTVCILPQDSHGEANEFCDIVVPTGMGMARDFVNALAADGVVVIGGGSGTLSEMCAAYAHRRPTVAVAGTGGMADAHAGTHIDGRKKQAVGSAPTAAGAVRMVLGMIRPST